MHIIEDLGVLLSPHRTSLPKGYHIIGRDSSLVMLIPKDAAESVASTNEPASCEVDIIQCRLRGDLIETSTGLRATTMKRVWFSILVRNVALDRLKSVKLAAPRCIYQSQQHHHHQVLFDLFHCVSCYFADSRLHLFFRRLKNSHCAATVWLWMQ